MSTVFSRDRDVAQAVSICRALAKMPPDVHGNAPDTDDVQGKFPDYQAVSWMLAYDARLEAVKRVWRQDRVSIYWRDQQTDHLAAHLLKDGWLPDWYTRSYAECSIMPLCAEPRMLVKGAVDQRSDDHVDDRVDALLALNWWKSHL